MSNLLHSCLQSLFAPWQRVRALMALGAARAASSSPVGRGQAPQSAAGLTHHQILTLVAPFTTAGLQLDLASSHRMARQLRFQPLDHPPVGALPALRETWQLSSPHAGWFRLTRGFALDGLQGSLLAEGVRPGDLLACLRAVPVDTLVQAGGGHCMVRSYHLVGDTLVPTAARLRTPQLEMEVVVHGSHSRSADLRLHPVTGKALQLPVDLLAVLGWDWSPLRFRDGCWSATLRLRRQGCQRADELGRKLERTTQHLLRTLGEPPRRFHERLLRARQAVWLRLALPWLAMAALGLDMMLAAPLQQARDSVGAALALALPPALLLWSSCRSEQTQLAWPAWPRPLAATSWVAH